MPTGTPVVYPHITRLREEGFRIWYDEGIDPGADWSDEIAEALNNTACFLVFISPAAVASHNVKKEIVFALSKKKHMIALHIEPTQLPLGLEMQLGNIQAILEDRYNSKEKFYEKLVGVLPSETRGARPDTAAEAPVPPPSRATGYTPGFVPVAPKPKDTPPATAHSTPEEFEVEDRVLKKYHGYVIEVDVPQGVTKIGPSAFSSDTDVERVTLPEGVESIEVMAFANCRNLQDLRLPASLETISYGALAGCHMLQSTCHRGSAAERALQKVGQKKIRFYEDEVQAAPAEDLFPAVGRAIIAFQDGAYSTVPINALLTRSPSGLHDGLAPDYSQQPPRLTRFAEMSRLVPTQRDSGEIEFTVTLRDESTLSITGEYSSIDLLFPHEGKPCARPLAELALLTFEDRPCCPGLEALIVYLKDGSLVRMPKSLFLVGSQTKPPPDAIAPPPLYRVEGLLTNRGQNIPIDSIETLTF